MGMQPTVEEQVKKATKSSEKSTVTLAPNPDESNAARPVTLKKEKKRTALAIDGGDIDEEKSDSSSAMGEPMNNPIKKTKKMNVGDNNVEVNTVPDPSAVSNFRIFVPLRATRGSFASKHGIPNVSKQVALAFARRTLIRCKKFEMSGASCFFGPALRDILFTTPSGFDEPKLLNGGSLTVANDASIHQLDFAFAKEGPIWNPAKGKEVLLDDVGGAVFRGSSGTWELQLNFPHLHLEDKVIPMGWGDDTGFHSPSSCSAEAKPAHRNVDSPVRATASRVVLHNGIPQPQWLVHWASARSTSPTWEPVQWLQSNFPNLHLEDKVIPMGEGVDTDSDFSNPSDPAQQLVGPGSQASPTDSTEEDRAQSIYSSSEESEAH